MNHFLTSYQPLVASKEGRRAIEAYDLPPYVDYSCRREPDFESRYPSITAICRASKFAPRLREGDIAVYITKKGMYPGHPESHWRVTAALKVIRRFASHRDAAEWYERQGVALPSNCGVRENPPLDLDHTGGRPRNFRTDAQWDGAYRKRVRENPMLLACDALHLELDAPPVLTSECMLATFGKVPGTQTPPRITRSQYLALADRFS